MDSNAPTISESRVAFRVVGDFLDPDIVTASLGVTPTHAHRKGQLMSHHSERCYHTGVWLLESTLLETEPVDEQLHQIMGMLSSRANSIQQLIAEGLKAEFYCSYFFNREQGGVLELSPETLAELASMRIPLGISAIWMG
jgi:hypothetical protein